MFVERSDESGNERLRRKTREEEAMHKAIRAHDAETVPNAIEDMALTQLNNQVRRIPLDYAGIMRGRAARPEFFMHLPSDAECRKMLGLPELTDAERVEALKQRSKR